MQMRKAWMVVGVLGMSALACGTKATATSEDDAIVTADTTGTDAVTADAADVASVDAAQEVSIAVETCTEPGGAPFVETTQPDVTRKKFALSLFHFNIEYVIGGLEYIDAAGISSTFTSNPANVGWTNDKVEDFIVRETFLPMLQMYEKHPGWGVNLEMQAYMVDVMAARHPDVLALLRKLAQRGQAELVSFHYNDQLFLAFPREDLHRSIAATKETFKKHCLPLSGVVFNQEGQAGEGRQQMLVAEGYSIGVHPKNLFFYVQQGIPDPWPYYASEGGDLIVGAAGVDAASGINLAWNFFDDGELRAAPEVSGQELNPYFATTAAHDPARVAAFEADLEKTEKSGYFMARISDYVRHLKAEKVEQKPAPALLDGTWQPSSTDSIHRWLGGRGLWGSDENDFEVRKGNYEVRTRLAALEVLAAAAKKAGKSVENQDARLAQLWKQLWRVEVSDCSGVNPWLAEVQFALERNPKILGDIDVLATELKTGLGWKNAQVNLAAATAEDKAAVAETWPTVDAPADVSTVTVKVDGRDVKTTWLQVSPTRWRVQIAFGAASADNDPFGRELKVTFPRFANVIEYSPGLLDDVVRTYPFSAFSFKDDHVWLPIPNGIVGLGNGWYVIKHARSEHVAARINFTAPTIGFWDETVPLALTPTWQFDVLKGTADDALKVGLELNIAPTVNL